MARTTSRSPKLTLANEVLRTLAILTLLIAGLVAYCVSDGAIRADTHAAMPYERLAGSVSDVKSPYLRDLLVAEGEVISSVAGMSDVANLDTAIAAGIAQQWLTEAAQIPAPAENRASVLSYLAALQSLSDRRFGDANMVLLTEGLNRGQLDCDTQSHMMIAAGREAGIHLQAVGSPGHAFIAYQLGADGEMLYWETRGDSIGEKDGSEMERLRSTGFYAPIYDGLSVHLSYVFAALTSRSHIETGAEESQLLALRTAVERLAPYYLAANSGASNDSNRDSAAHPFGTQFTFVALNEMAALGDKHPELFDRLRTSGIDTLSYIKDGAVYHSFGQFGLDGSSALKLNTIEWLSMASSFIGSPLKDHINAFKVADGDFFFTPYLAWLSLKASRGSFLLAAYLVSDSGDNYEISGSAIQVVAAAIYHATLLALLVIFCLVLFAWVNPPHKGRHKEASLST